MGRWVRISRRREAERKPASVVETIPISTSLRIGGTLMALVTKISCRVDTGDETGASTDGFPYLGLGGREFRLDTSHDDFQRHPKDDPLANFEYIFGEGANVLFPERNDPRRDFVLDTDRLDEYPIYIRFDPESASDHWRLRFALTLVYEAGDFVRAVYFSRTREGIWLGKTAGKFLHLTRFRGFGDARILSEGDLAGLRAQMAP
jgi:hypothetical protein